MRGQCLPQTLPLLQTIQWTLTCSGDAVEHRFDGCCIYISNWTSLANTWMILASFQQLCCCVCQQLVQNIRWLHWHNSEPYKLIKSYRVIIYMRTDYHFMRDDERAWLTTVFSVYESPSKRCLQCTHTSDRALGQHPYLAFQSRKWHISGCRSLR